MVIPVPEEQLIYLTKLTGCPKKGAKHADLICFNLPSGGSVFAVSAIAFCGSLPWNGFDNAVSRLLGNHLRRKRGADWPPYAEPGFKHVSA